MHAWGCWHACMGVAECQARCMCSMLPPAAVSEAHSLLPATGAVSEAHSHMPATGAVSAAHSLLPATGAGNVTERCRYGVLPAAGETVVDLYTGIGYYTLPLLVRAGVAKVYACEWNPHAVEALR
jgi:hypothetical protein